MPGARAPVPTLDEIYRLTEQPEERVVFRGVDWAFYEQFVDSIPESAPIHVDYDGKDLEVMSKGRIHERIGRRADRFISVVAEEWEIPFTGCGETTWKRKEIARGLESDQSYYFVPEKVEADVTAERAGSDDIADYPNPDLAVEVDISPPKADRAAIYATLRVPEVWRFTQQNVVIERLTPGGKYKAVKQSRFLPVRADDLRRWVLEEDWSNEVATVRKLRAEIRKKASH
jgi:Uma2 family endonuclease